jgi:hypothetical protein
VLTRLDAYNGGTTATTVTVSCAGQAPVSTSLAADHLATISTGWTGACTTITIASSNGWDTNYDNLVLASPSAGTPPTVATVGTPTTPVPSSTPPIPAPGGGTMCAPRPPVGVATETIEPGLLRVTITATTSTGTPDNALRELRFGAARNALIEVDGQAYGVGSMSLALAPGTRQSTFTVRRASPGAVTVPFSVFDGCGEWPTFVGGGPSAF